MKTKQTSWPCALCGNPSTVRGVFIPDESQHFLYGAPAGMTRFLFYGLCDRCISRGPVIIPEVEQRALAECVGHTWN